MSITKIQTAEPGRWRPTATDSSIRETILNCVGSLSRRICLVTNDEFLMHEFAELIRGPWAPDEMRTAAVRLAYGMSGARRVDLLLDEIPGARPRRVACWPESAWEEPSTGTLADVQPRVAPQPSPLVVPLRFGGRARGAMRLVPATSRAWSGRLVRRLHTFCALVAAAECTIAMAGDDSSCDAGTGVRSPAFLHAFLTHSLAQSKRRAEPLSVLCIGTGFRTPGTAAERASAGAIEAWQHRVARAVVGTLRSSDIVARMGQGRFSAVLPGAAATDALVIAEAVRRAIIEAGQAASLLTPPPVAVGVASYPDHANEAGPLLACAAEALARARVHAQGAVAAAPLLAPAQTSTIIKKAMSCG